MRKRTQIFLLGLILVAIGISAADWAVMAARCTPSSQGKCTACSNCKYCKNCSKDGGTCSVCKR